jgi:hypothetical protein
MNLAPLAALGRRPWRLDPVSSDLRIIDADGHLIMTFAAGDALGERGAAAIIAAMNEEPATGTCEHCEQPIRWTGEAWEDRAGHAECGINLAPHVPLPPVSAESAALKKIHDALVARRHGFIRHSSTLGIYVSSDRNKTRQLTDNQMELVAREALGIGKGAS